MEYLCSRYLPNLSEKLLVLLSTQLQRDGAFDTRVSERRLFSKGDFSFRLQCLLKSEKNLRGILLIIHFPLLILGKSVGPISRPEIFAFPLYSFLVKTSS